MMKIAQKSTRISVLCMVVALRRHTLDLQNNQINMPKLMQFNLIRRHV